ncbi:MAG TPA: ATP-grasp domain-containing protein [Polyangiaceae bacterium]|nr:ATP-grasp domain-containing protein [Polyangiaceae bacterium]
MRVTPPLSSPPSQPPAPSPPAQPSPSASPPADARPAWSPPPGTAVGLLGGGQLARMLARAALDLGLRPVVFAQRGDDPAALACRDVVEGEVGDGAALRAFLASVSVVAFENEFVPCEALEQASEGLPLRFGPGLGVLGRLRDKLGQKEVLAALGVPSAPYLVHDPAEPFEAWADRARGAFGGLGCVLKWSCFGYDGKGTLALDAAGPLPAELGAFGAEAFARGARLFAEQRVPFRRELALCAAYSTAGEFAAYPLVITRQERGVCVEVRGPARALGVDPGLEAIAVDYARRLAEGLGLTGVFALEAFELASGELWINEIAPRVHNSGHYTLDAAETSQFENHWRALLGLPLGRTGGAAGFVMRNLLGPEGVRAAAAGLPLPPLAAGTHLHWYGKVELRPGRKLGHLNGVAPPDALDALAASLEGACGRWAEELRCLINAPP